MTHISIKVALIFFAALALSACESIRNVHGETAVVLVDAMPTSREIETIEAKLIMPKGGQLISSYVRYYKYEFIDGHKFVIGSFVRTAVNPRVVIVKPEDFPYNLDGGCDAIHLRYAVEERKLDAIICGGRG